MRSQILCIQGGCVKYHDRHVFITTLFFQQSKQPFYKAACSLSDHKALDGKVLRPKIPH